MTKQFNSQTAAEAFVQAAGLPAAAIEVAGIKWIGGSPKITYSVRVPA